MEHLPSSPPDAYFLLLPELIAAPCPADWPGLAEALQRAAADPHEHELPLLLGTDTAGVSLVVDLTRLPHLLVTGAPQSGKSCLVNALVLSLLLRARPGHLRLVLLDPKGVELAPFERVAQRFLARLPGKQAGVIRWESAAVETLTSLTRLLSEREQRLHAAGCRSLSEYHNRQPLPDAGEVLPYVVVVVDELAGFGVSAELLALLTHLAAHGRAVGVHLVVSATHVAPKFLPPTLRANLPVRLALRPAGKSPDDPSGLPAIQAPGEFLLPVSGQLWRGRAPWLDHAVVERICEYLATQAGPAEIYELPALAAAPPERMDDNDDERDALFAEAARVIVTHQQGSTSLLQRRLKLGYNRAGRLLEQLEKAGVVGPFEGSKNRDVLVPDEYALEQLLARLEGDVASTKLRPAIALPQFQVTQPESEFSTATPLAPPPAAPVSAAVPVAAPTERPPVAAPRRVFRAETSSPPPSPRLPDRADPERSPNKKADAPAVLPLSWILSILFVGIMAIPLISYFFDASEPLAAGKPSVGASTALPVAQVTSRVGIKLRTGPSATAGVVGVIPCQAQVELIGSDSVVTGTLGTPQAPWCKVIHLGQAGWVWGGYLGLRSEANSSH